MRKIRILLLALLLLPSIVCAKENFKYEEKLNIDGKYNATTFFSGDKINSEAEINGISFMAGTEINLDGKLDYAIHMAEDLTLDGKVNNDAFIMSGKQITISGEVKRDAYLLSDNIYIDGNIGRNFFGYATTIKIENANIKGNLYLRATEIEFGKNVKIEGKIKYNKNAIIKGEENIKNIKTETYAIKTNKVSISDYIINILNSTLQYVVVGLLLMIFMPNLFKKLDKEKNYSDHIAKGFIGLFVVPIACIFLIVIPYTRSLAFILLALYIIFIYLSFIFSGYIVGNLVMKNHNNNYLNLLIGLLILKILTYMPYIGSFVSMGALLIGLGFLLNNIKRAKN